MEISRPGQKTGYLDPQVCRQENYALNPNWMMHSNLEIWLSEMEETFGKRYCPCFEPSGDAQLDNKMFCPCKFLDDEIAEYGTCHCTLFGSPTLTKGGWKASNQRLTQEALNLQKIAAYRGFGETHAQKDNHYEVIVTLDGSVPKGTSSSCGAALDSHQLTSFTP